jgi:ribonuclease VapC
VAVYEATLGLVRILRRSVEDAETDVMELLRLARVIVQPIQPETAHLALQAFARQGRGRGRPAGLNLGDCFIYAQAKVGGASLLYKGSDFSETDIESASWAAAASPPPSFDRRPQRLHIPPPDG